MPSGRFRSLVLFVWVFAVSGLAALAASGPAITLHVDASDAPLKIIRVHMEIPVKPGPLTLYYPKWIPGEHGPDGPIDNVTGLEMKAGAQTVPWRRDLLDVFTFHVDVPQGADTLEVSFQYIEPSGGPFTGGASATDKMAVISFNQDLLYPAGAPAKDILFKLGLRLPEGWKYGTPLPIDHESGSEIEFKPVDLERLVDSPVIAGEYFRAVDVTPPGEPIHHEIDLAGDSAGAIEMSPDLRQHYVNLVAESGKLFGARHYRDYHFLLSLSNHVAHFGLEHNESNDSRVGEDGITTGRRRTASLLPHEFVHSWNGKFRRPADLTTPDYEQPMKTDLLWVYEGLTDYLGPMLTARSGLWTPEQYRDHIAGIAAQLGPGRPGRTWRDLQDTTFAPLLRGGGWTDWKRGADYYDEGDLVWLWVDTIIRNQTHGQKSIDDFCHIFHGGPNNGPEVKPYTFEEMVSTLNQVAPYDWAAFFRQRLESLSPEAPVGGIEAAGWKVEYTEKESEGGRRGGGGGPGGGGFVNAAYSIGLALNGDGQVMESIWNGPAFRAGITPGMEVVAVNGRKFTPEIFNIALKATKTSTAPIELLVFNDDYYKAVKIDYHGGPRFPHLVRIEGKPDTLSEIIKARAPGPSTPEKKDASGEQE